MSHVDSFGALAAPTRKVAAVDCHQFNPAGAVVAGSEDPGLSPAAGQRVEAAAEFAEPALDRAKKLVVNFLHSSLDASDRRVCVLFESLADRLREEFLLRRHLHPNRLELGAHIDAQMRGRLDVLLAPQLSLSAGTLLLIRLGSRLPLFQPIRITKPKSVSNRTIA